MMKKLNRQIIVTVAALGGVVLACLLSLGEPHRSGVVPHGSGGTQSKGITVSTIKPEIGPYRAQVSGNGQIVPVQSLSLSAEVSGQVVALSPAFKSGTLLKKGEWLLKIDDTEYQKVVASAASAVASAEVTLLQQQLNQSQAQAEWQRSGLAGQPDSELVFYAPQVKSAKAALESAQKTLKKAQADLHKTTVRVPFNALVVAKSVTLGSYVQAGATLADIYGSDQVEVELALSSWQWDHLPESLPKNTRWPVTLFDTESTKQWQGYIDRYEQSINTTSRQRALVVRVDNPLSLDKPLFAGTFVKADIKGKTFANVMRIPLSAVTQNNDIWYVDAQNNLNHMPAQIRFRSDDDVYISPSPQIMDAEIVAQPLSSYLPGMRVKQATPSNGKPAAVLNPNTQGAQDEFIE